MSQGRFGRGKRGRGLLVGVKADGEKGGAGGRSRLSCGLERSRRRSTSAVFWRRSAALCLSGLTNFPSLIIEGGLRGRRRCRRTFAVFGRPSSCPSRRLGNDLGRTDGRRGRITGREGHAVSKGSAATVRGVGSYQKARGLLCGVTVQDFSRGRGDYRRRRGAVVCFRVVGGGSLCGRSPGGPKGSRRRRACASLIFPSRRGRWSSKGVIRRRFCGVSVSAGPSLASGVDSLGRVRSIRNEEKK